MSIARRVTRSAIRRAVSTPEIHEGRVYTIGAMGQMFCLDAKTGKELWSKDFVKDFNTKLPIWGMVASPLSSTGAT